MGIEDNLTETQAQIFVWAGMAICIVLTTTRGFIRWRNHKTFYADDYWAFSSTLCLIVTALHVHYMLPGLYESERLTEGKQAQMSQSDYLTLVPRYLKLEISAMCFFWAALWCVKLSFLALIWRVLLGRQTYRVWWQAIVVYVMFTYVAEIFINIFACVPVPRRWSLNPDESCGKERSGLVLQSICVAFDISSDLAIMILPLKVLSGMRLSKKRRLAVQAMFGLGIVVITVAAVRCALTAVADPSNFDRVLWICWTWSEPWTAVLIVNIPPLSNLIALRKHATSIKSSYFSNKPSYRSKGPTDSNINMQLNHIEPGLAKHSLDSQEWLNSPGIPSVITNHNPRPCPVVPKRSKPPPTHGVVIPQQSLSSKSSKDFKDFKPFKKKPNSPDEHGITVISDVEVTTNHEEILPEDLQVDHPKHLEKAWR